MKQAAPATAPLRAAGLAPQHSRPAAAAAPTWAHPSVHAVLGTRGRPLDTGTRERMESRFGSDLGEVRVHTSDGAACSAREPAGAPPLQRQEVDEEVAPVPAWALSTPMGALPGAPVPGYDTPRAEYTEEDRAAMLAALNRRVQLNGWRLATDLASDDSGLSLATQTIAGIFSALLTAPLGPVSGVVVGVIADTLVNATDELISEREVEERRRRRHQLLATPEVSDVGQRGANARLAGLLLDAVGYATWLQVCTLDDLWKFRVPPEFPWISEQEIRAEIATANARRHPRVPRAALRQRRGAGGLPSAQGTLHRGRTAGCHRAVPRLHRPVHAALASQPVALGQISQTGL